GFAFRVAMLSEVCRLMGHGEEAWQHAHQALDLARQIKERRDEPPALYQLGVLHAHADPPDVAQAEPHYQQALALANELGLHAPPRGPLPPGPRHPVCHDRSARASPRRPVHRHGPVPRHGHGLLVTPGRGGAGAGGGAVKAAYTALRAEVLDLLQHTSLTLSR